MTAPVSAPAPAESAAPGSRHVLVARLDSLGDVLVTGPAVRAIAARQDVGRVTFLCGSRGVAGAVLLPGVTETLVWDSPWTGEAAPEVDPGDVSRFCRAIADLRVDEAVIFTSFHQTPLPLALLLRVAGVPRISAASVDGPGTLLDNRIRPGEDFPEDQHEVLRALRIAGAADFHLAEGDDGRMRVAIPPGKSPVAGSGPYVVVHPGADAPSRAWPVEHHRRLTSLLASRGYRVLVTGGPGERALTAQVAGTSGTDLGGRTCLSDLARILAGAEVVVVGNTGPAHLAAAVGTPVVSLFSPVVPATRWQPYGVPLELLGDQDAPCGGTRARECPVPGHPCLESVTPTQVLAAVARFSGPPVRRPVVARSAE